MQKCITGIAAACVILPRQQSFFYKRLTDIINFINLPINNKLSNSQN